MSELRSTQFTLRALFVALTLVATLLGTALGVGRGFLAECSGFFYSCLLVGALMVLMDLFERELEGARFPVALYVMPILYAALAMGFGVFGGVIDQPHPVYAEGSWLSRRMRGAIPLGACFAVVAFLLVSFDGICQRERPRDIAYFPRLSGVRRSLSHIGSRWLLIVGFLLLGAYYTNTALDLWWLHQAPGGLIWPPGKGICDLRMLMGTLLVCRLPGPAKRGDNRGIDRVSDLLVLLCIAVRIRESAGVKQVACER